MVEFHGDDGARLALVGRFRGERRKEIGVVGAASRGEQHQGIQPAEATRLEIVQVDCETEYSCGIGSLGRALMVDLRKGNRLPADDVDHTIEARYATKEAFGYVEECVDRTFECLLE